MQSGTTLTALIEDSLREALARRREARPDQPIELATFRGEGLLPGVDLRDGVALRNRMDGFECS
ncbi:MAG: DUF2191 domain-containing protein [Armatimonadetes bacterium]|nr:DUF2191 domain-containing protein [Armatimonadota bacterium]